MVDVVTTASTIIFIGILLIVGAVVFGTIADPMGDQWYPNETIIAAGCSNITVGDPALCSGIVDHPPIENVTRAAPIIYNCSSDGATCQTVTSQYNYSKGDGTIYMTNDTWNGSIKVDYWSDTALTGADNAQQSITSIAYGGFDLATVLVIVMAAVGIVSAIFLIGRRGA